MHPGDYDLMHKSELANRLVFSNARSVNRAVADGRVPPPILRIGSGDPRWSRREFDRWVELQAQGLTAKQAVATVVTERRELVPAAA